MIPLWNNYILYWVHYSSVNMETTNYWKDITEDFGWNTFIASILYTDLVYFSNINYLPI